ncbi:MAG: hypothetical protein K0R17_4091 [Rariglobus sp.]|jgi:hypothetical protein|nr:hypothetical protein [Rariglobus sp.]
MLRCLLLLGCIGLFSGCIHVKLDPVQVHATVDVNVKVDRALDDFFGDIDKKSTTINPSANQP